MCSKNKHDWFGKFTTFFGEFLPCLTTARPQRSHELAKLRKSTFRKNEKRSENHSEEDKGKQKIFTIETMKKVNPIKRKSSAVENNDEITNDELSRNNCLVLEKCPWDTKSGDMFLRVGNSLFLVDQFLLSIESEILNTIFDSVSTVKNITPMVTLHGYEADEIKMLLTFVFLPESEINDENILILLRLADELMMEELVIRCEDFLLATDNFPPITLLNLASKYQLPSLEEAAAIKASKIPRIAEHVEEFASLTEKQQRKVSLLAKNRFRSSGPNSVMARVKAEEVIPQDPITPELMSKRKLQERETNIKGRLTFLPAEQQPTETASSETT
eukprot:gene15289-16867_t